MGLDIFFPLNKWHFHVKSEFLLIIIYLFYVIMPIFKIKFMWNVLMWQICREKKEMFL